MRCFFIVVDAGLTRHTEMHLACANATPSRYCTNYASQIEMPTMDGGARRYAPRTVRKIRFRHSVKLYMHNSYSILTAKR